MPRGYVCHCITFWKLISGGGDFWCRNRFETRSGPDLNSYSLTIYRSFLIGRDGHPDQSEAYDISQQVRAHGSRYSEAII